MELNPYSDIAYDWQELLAEVSGSNQQKTGSIMIRSNWTANFAREMFAIFDRIRDRLR